MAIYQISQSVPVSLQPPAYVPVSHCVCIVLLTLSSWLCPPCTFHFAFPFSPCPSSPCVLWFPSVSMSVQLTLRAVISECSPLFIPTIMGLLKMGHTYILCFCPIGLSASVGSFICYF